MYRSIAFLWLLLASSPLISQSPGQGDTLILADPGDPYYALAEEMAQHETLPIVHTLDEALAQDPAFILWVVSPEFLSDQIMVDFGLALREREKVVSVGIITGSTLEDARELWQRGRSAHGERVFAANAQNPSGHIEAQIVEIDGDEGVGQSLSLSNLLASLKVADYLTFTGHGGSSYLALDKGISLRSGHIPDLPPLVMATGSCNTFRPWEANSIALAFTDKGAAAYAGFAYSPNEGYLIGEFDGLPFRFTWPNFPIGHAVQVQNQGTLQGFAQFPYYWLLGDPRIALQVEAPYRLVETQSSNGSLTLSYAGAPAGIIPVRVDGGAKFSFVEIPGVGAAWKHDPFYNAHLQMVDIGRDKFVLFEHEGGDFSLRLRTNPPWYWVPADILTDAFEHTLLFVQEGGGALVFAIIGVLALIPVAALLLRKKASTRTLLLAALTGLGFALLHGLFALARLHRLTITSKMVIFHPLSLVGTFLLASCGAFLFLNAKSWRGRVIAVLVASLGALAAAVFTLGLIALSNAFALGQGLSVGPWNYSLGLQPLVVFVFECILFGLAFSLLNRA